MCQVQYDGLLFTKVYNGTDPKNHEMILEVAEKVLSDYKEHMKWIEEDKLRRCLSHDKYKNSCEKCGACQYYINVEDGEYSHTGKNNTTYTCKKCGHCWSVWG